MATAQALPNSRTEIASIAIPVKSQGLLLPNESVAEIIAATPLMQQSNTPDWFQGYQYWREQLVPCVDIDQLLGEENTGTAKFRAVLNFTGLTESIPFVAISASSAPASLRITEDEIEKQEYYDMPQVALMKVMAAGRELVIPNVRYIEELLVEAEL